MRQRWSVIVLVAVLSFFSGGWLLQRGAGTDAAVFRQARIFDDVLNHVRANFVDSIPEAELYEKAARGLLEQLKDPYSDLLTADDFAELTEKTSGNYAGLGIQIDPRTEGVMVVAPLPESPAERAGIESGDIIVEVDGKPAQGWSSDQALRTLRGEAGTKVTIGIRRAGVEQVIPFTIERATIHVKSVPSGTLFDGGIGYIALNPVAETSAQELQDEITAMRTQGMRKLVLDLRGNPGGLLDQGVKVADLFLDAKQEIVSTRGRARGSTRSFVDAAPQAHPELPIVVLVNEFSASAAEIIAGALQDHDRALVVGTPTFGKGLVQSLYQLGETTALKLTTAKWYTPSGRTIQRDAKDATDQALQALADGGVIVDSTRAAPDTSVAARPVFKTDAGRTVRGGGGIVPDVIVRQDSLSAAEREFIRALGDKAGAYRDVVTSYALELKAAGAVRAESFAVTPTMLDEVARRLRERGATVTAAQFAGGAELVRQQLGYEVARYAFGRPAEFRRRAADDPQMREAMRLLRDAKSPRDLLTLAAAAAPTPGAN